jgi:HD-GYP domain-containing protein (c-di-GMP phosphodiesterase class II)
LLESKILAVADLVEAMAWHRPYRPALGIEAALNEITTHRGTSFDTDVVDKCLRIFHEQGYKIDD